MVPIHECYGEVLIEFERGIGVMDKKGAEETVWVLTHGVGVVPVGSRSISLCSVSSVSPSCHLIISAGRPTYHKIISKTTSRRHWTLRDPTGAIHILRPILMKSMPMQTSTLIAELIIHMNNDPVA